MLQRDWIKLFWGRNSTTLLRMACAEARNSLEASCHLNEKALCIVASEMRKPREKSQYLMQMASSNMSLSNFL